MRQGGVGEAKKVLVSKGVGEAGKALEILKRGQE